MYNDISAGNSSDKISNIIKRIPYWDPAHYFKKFLDKYNSFTAIISGSRMSGKSNFLKFCLLHKDGGKLIEKFDMIVVFSETIKSNEFYNFLNTKLKFETFDPGVIQLLKRLHDQRKSEGKRFRFLLIFDDMAVGMKYQQEFIKFFCNSRHYGGSIFFLTQKSSLIGQDCKNNATLYCILKNGSMKERRYLSNDVVADGVSQLLPNIISKSEIENISNKVQLQLLRDYGMIVMTPFCEVMMKQFKPPLIKTVRIAKKKLENNLPQDDLPKDD